MLEALAALSRSRKVILSVTSILAVAVLAGFGRVPMDQALGFLTFVITTLVGSIAVEDAAGKLATKTEAPNTQVSVSVPQASPSQPAPIPTPEVIEPGIGPSGPSTEAGKL